MPGCHICLPETGPACGDRADPHGYQSLLDCLAAVPEPRRRCGIRHRMAVVLAFAVAAVLAGADSVTAIGEWAADVPPEVLEALDAWQDRRGRRIPPSLKTFRRVLRRLDAEAVGAAFGRWLTGQVLAGLADATALVVALDGKTVRGARTRDGQGAAPAGGDDLRGAGSDRPAGRRCQDQ